MHLHLFSSPGDDLEYIIEASRPYLEGRHNATVAYLPLASLYAERWLEPTADAFKNLARVETVNAELMTQKEIEDLLRGCSLVYVPGGNTFLLNHRLHMSGLTQFLRKKVQAGLPFIGFSAGAIICGPNILTSRDMNTLATPHFDGLNITPFNFFAHYARDGHGQSLHDEWLSDYHFFNDNPVIMLCDGSHVQVEGKKTTLVRGEAWILRKDCEKEKLDEGKAITL